MTPFIRITTIAALILALVSGAALGQEAETPANAAESLANQAIADLAAWKNKSARKILQKGKAEYGSTPEFQTAWALLEIQEGADDNQKKVDKGIKSLTQMTKKRSVDAVATYYRGEVLYQQSKRKEASAAWQAAARRAGELVAADPKDATAQFYLGASLSFPRPREGVREGAESPAEGEARGLRSGNGASPSGTLLSFRQTMGKGQA